MNHTLRMPLSKTLLQRLLKPKEKQLVIRHEGDTAFVQWDELQISMVDGKMIVRLLADGTEVTKFESVYTEGNLASIRGMTGEIQVNIDT